MVLALDLDDIINAAPELAHAVKQRVGDIAINYTCQDNYFHPDNGLTWTVTADCTYWANVTDCVGERLVWNLPGVRGAVYCSCERLLSKRLYYFLCSESYLFLLTMRGQHSVCFAMLLKCIETALELHVPETELNMP